MVIGFAFQSIGSGLLYYGIPFWLAMLVQDERCGAPTVAADHK
jgi:hypothetical protein